MSEQDGTFVFPEDSDDHDDSRLFVSPGRPSTSEAFHSSSPPQPPRLSSPRLLRSALSTRASTSTLPQPVNYQDTLRDVEHALHNADMALRNAQAAFRHGRMAHASSNGVVDLTATSDDANDDLFMTQTRHPHDSNRTSRPANAMNEPAYGPPPPLPPANQDRQLPSFRSFLEPNISLHPPHDSDPRHYTGYTEATRSNTQADASAVRRQNQARRSWERVARRNRQRAQQLAEREAEERDRRGQTMQQPPQQGPNSTRRLRRPSNTSNASSDSESSGSSVASGSSQSDVAVVTDYTRPAETSVSTIDLTGVDDSKTLSNVLAKEQQDAIAAQAESTVTSGNANASSLNSYKCAICMESPTNATTTTCGHLFCHKCILDSLKWSERQRREDQPPGRRVQGLCPVCRKPLLNKEFGSAGSKTSGGLVNLEIKKIPRKQYQQRKEQDEFFGTGGGKGKQRAKTAEHDVEPEAIGAIKIDIDDNSQSPGLAGGRGRRKRKRETTSQARADSVDSLFD